MYACSIVYMIDKQKKLFETYNKYKLLWVKCLMFKLYKE